MHASRICIHEFIYFYLFLFFYFFFFCNKAYINQQEGQRPYNKSKGKRGVDLFHYRWERKEGGK
jgi:hypothetical protein